MSEKEPINDRALSSVDPLQGEDHPVMSLESYQILYHSNRSIESIMSLQGQSMNEIGELGAQAIKFLWCPIRNRCLLQNRCQIAEWAQEDRYRFLAERLCAECPGAA